MQQIDSNGLAGQFRIFVTERGQHAPEMMAAMSLHQLVDNDSNPLKRAEIRQALAECYAGIQRVARIMFNTTQGNDMLNRAIIQILSKDFAVALDIERQFHKE